MKMMKMEVSIAMVDPQVAFLLFQYKGHGHPWLDDATPSQVAQIIHVMNDHGA